MEVGHALSQVGLPTSCWTLLRSAMEEEAQLPLPGSPAPNRQYGGKQWKKVMQLPQPDMPQPLWPC